MRNIEGGTTSRTEFRRRNNELDMKNLLYIFLLEGSTTSQTRFRRRNNELNMTNPIDKNEEFINLIPKDKTINLTW